MARLIEIIVPDIGDFEEVDVIEVLVEAGDQIAAEDTLLTLETDKAAMEIPASEAGLIREVRVAVGDKISRGDVIFVIEAGEAIEESSAKESVREMEPPLVSTETNKESTESPSPQPKPGRVQEVPKKHPAPLDATLLKPADLPLASPAVRRFSRELGVDLSQIEGSGPSHRILKEDIQNQVKARMKEKLGGEEGCGAKVLPWPKIDFSRFGGTRIEALSRIQKLSGANLHRNWSMIPHVTQHDEADITDMEAFRKESQSATAARGAKMTPLVFLIKTCVAALKAHPRFNASLSGDGESLVLKSYFHIGVAVDTPDGLLVPVLRDCDQKSLIDLAVELKDLSARARKKRLTLAEMEGGCFTISSLGGIGGTAFTPIINAPEVAILGVSRASIKAVYSDGVFIPRLILPFSLSYDHRVIDGASAARFTQTLSRLLSDVRRLLL